MFNKTWAYACILICGFVLQAGNIHPAMADWLYTPGGGPSKFLSFNTGGPNTGTSACAATNTDCLAYVPINTAGAPFGTNAVPFRVDPTGTTTQPVSAASLPLPTSAATSALQTTGNAALSTINTTLGTPFQAGGSIGNTSFAVTNAGTFAAQLTGATNNINNIAGTVSLPTGASTSTKQSDGTQKSQIVDGSGNVIASTSNNLNVQCANCSGSGVSAADAATFTAGSSLMAPIGAQFTSVGATACVTGHECTLGAGADRTLFTQLPHAEVAIGGATAPADALVGGMVYNSGGIAPSNGQGLALQSDASGNLRVVGVGVAQASTTSGQTGSLVMGAVTTSPPSYTTAQTSPLSLDVAGNLRVNVVTGGGSGGTSSSFGSAFPGTGTAIGLTNGTNMVAWSATSNYGTAPSAIAVPAVNAAVTNTVAYNQTQYLTTAVVANPCLTGTIIYVPISQATSTQLASLGGSSKKNYVCAIDVVSADAENISLVEGTGSVCATTTAAIMGGTTAANGWNFAANSGIAKGNGAAPVAAGSLTSLNNVCLLQSGTGRLAGALVLAQQ